MNVEAFRDLLQANPFQPFRIVMVNGEKFDVRHPETALLTQSSIQVGVDVGDDGIPDTFRVCSLADIAKVKQLAGKKRRR